MAGSTKLGNRTKARGGNNADDFEDLDQAIQELEEEAKQSAAKNERVKQYRGVKEAEAKERKSQCSAQKGTKNNGILCWLNSIMQAMQHVTPYRDLWMKQCRRTADGALVDPAVDESGLTANGIEMLKNLKSAICTALEELACTESETSSSKVSRGKRGNEKSKKETNEKTACHQQKSKKLDFTALSEAITNFHNSFLGSKNESTGKMGSISKGQRNYWDPKKENDAEEFMNLIVSRLFPGFDQLSSLIIETQRSSFVLFTDSDLNERNKTLLPSTNSSAAVSWQPEGVATSTESVNHSSINLETLWFYLQWHPENDVLEMIRSQIYDVQEDIVALAPERKPKLELAEEDIQKYEEEMRIYEHQTALVARFGDKMKKADDDPQRYLILKKQETSRVGSLQKRLPSVVRVVSRAKIEVGDDKLELLTNVVHRREMKLHTVDRVGSVSLTGSETTYDLRAFSVRQGTSQLSAHFFTVAKIQQGENARWWVIDDLDGNKPVRNITKKNAEDGKVTLWDESYDEEWIDDILAGKKTGEAPQGADPKESKNYSWMIDVLHYVRSDIPIVGQVEEIAVSPALSTQPQNAAPELVSELMKSADDPFAKQSDSPHASFMSLFARDTELSPKEIFHILDLEWKGSHQWKKMKKPKRDELTAKAKEKLKADETAARHKVALDDLAKRRQQFTSSLLSSFNASEA